MDIASFLPELEFDVETPIPMRREGKQVYAKLLDFGGLPGPLGLRAKTHNVQNMDWIQIAWDHSIITKSGDSQKLTLQAASTPAISNSALPWRFAVDKNSVQCNMLTMTDYREWDRVHICVFYTKAGEGAVSGNLIVPGPEGAQLVSRDGQIVWEQGSGGVTLSDALDGDRKAADGVGASEWALAQVNARAGTPSYELCEFYYFRRPNLRPGFYAAQGGLLANAATLHPEAWAYLQTAEGSSLCKTEAEWQAMTRAIWHTNADGTQVGWNGIGGAPFYAPNTATGALRLPDLRGMYPEAAGFDALGVGGVHGDGIRNIAGPALIRALQHSSHGGGIYPPFVGSIIAANTAPQYITIAGHDLVNIGINVGTTVPVAAKNQVRAWGALACVYLGQPV